MFRSIIDQIEIAFFEIQLAECKIVKKLDLSILYQNTVFDYVRTLASRLEIDDKTLLDGYYRYVDNVYLYALMSDQYKYEITLSCLIMTLVYFTAKNEQEIVTKGYNLIFSLHHNKREDLKKINDCKSFVLKKLGELGSKAEELDFLNDRLDFEAYLGNSVQESTIID